MLLFWTAIFLLPNTLLGNTPRVDVKLIAELNTIPEKASVAVILNVLKPWHIYFRNPGDSGLATRVSLTLPKEISVVAEHWAVPQRFEKNAHVTYGYEGETFLLYDLNVAPGVAKPYELKVLVRWLACHDICVPGKSMASTKLQSSLKGEGQKKLAQLRASLAQKTELTVLKKEGIFEIPLPRSGEVHFFPWNPGDFENASTKGRGSVLRLVQSSHVKKVDSIQGILVFLESNKVKEALWLDASVR